MYWVKDKYVSNSVVTVIVSFLPICTQATRMRPIIILLPCPRGVPQVTYLEPVLFMIKTDAVVRDAEDEHKMCGDVTEGAA